MRLLSRALGTRYLDEDIWWVMHRSYLPNNATMALTAYFDDSGSDTASAITVIGGPVMSRQACLEFQSEWSQMLDLYDILHPLHMKDFPQGGKHARLPKGIKSEMFGKAARIINGFKLFSISIGVPQPEFNATLPEKVRKRLIGPYALAFFCAVLANRSICDQSALYGEQAISYLVDDGSVGKGQLMKAHTEIVKLETSTGGVRNTGSIDFDVDDQVSALQAADVVAWASRRKAVYGQLRGDFVPLEEVLSGPPNGSHVHIPIPLEGIEQVATPIMNWIDREGQIPSLSDIIAI